MTSSPIQFDDFIFDSERMQLTRADVPIHLKRQSAEILNLLLVHAGETVSRNTIRDALWRNRTVEFDYGINAGIRDIRQALGDDSRNPRYIETLSKRGYRFLPSIRKRNVFLRNRLVAAVVLALIVFALVADNSNREPGLGASTPRVAVMPIFVNENEELQQLAAAFDKNLISGLTKQATNLAIISPAHIFAGLSSRTPMAELSRRVMPDFIVAGSIDEMGEGFELNLRLVLVEGYIHIWTTSVQLDSTQSVPDVRNLVQTIIARISAQSIPTQQLMRKPATQ